MVSTRLLLLLSFCISFSVADDCYFLNSCDNATLPFSQCWNCTSGQTLPTAESTIIFQSVDNVTLSNVILVVRDIHIRDSQLTWAHSNVSSFNLSVTDSTFILNASTVLIRQDLSVQSNSSDIQFVDSTLSCESASFEHARLSFLPGVTNLNTFNSGHTLMADGTVNVGSEVSWTGYLDVVSTTIVHTPKGDKRAAITSSSSSVALEGTSILGPLSWFAESFTITNCTLDSTSPSITPNDSPSNSTISDRNFGFFNASQRIFGDEDFIIDIEDTVIRGRWTAQSRGVSQLKDIRGRSILPPGGHAKRLIIHRLIISTIYDNSYLNLSRSTSYTIDEISLSQVSSLTYTPVRGGIPTNFSDSIRTTSNCWKKDVTNYTVSVVYNETALYVTYVPPTPDIAYGWSNGTSLTLLLARIYLAQLCADDDLYSHHLIIEDGDHRRVIDHRESDTYTTFSLPDENSCTHKTVKVYLESEGHQITTRSKPLEVEIRPADVLFARYYPWGYYNETETRMTALAGRDSGKIQIWWNATGVPSICGWEAQEFHFGNKQLYIDAQSVPVSQGQFTYRTTPEYPVDATCIKSYSTIPSVSVVYTKEGSNITSSPFVPRLNDESTFYFYHDLMQVDAAITPDNFQLKVTNASASSNLKTLRAYNVSDDRCTCGDFLLVVQIYDLNETSALASFSLSKTKMETYANISYGRYIMYVTGTCTYHISSSVYGGYGQTIRSELVLAENKEEPPKETEPQGPSPLRWIIPVSVVGGLIVVAGAVVAFILIRKRQKRNYIPLQ
ncbi:hypothetical protein PROFUN_07152 [Planoprotostelium fungivorum]|uniref:Uncharacterized protein n=1 Tax=Planoprotostelium fungivorum TaxID=1890364 RepID=A0A2P6NML2_9EUKA|nr:hypothetical protein PROFUN_07152 [Planoprotostelium fungivorum]